MSAVHEALRDRFRPPEWIYATEVGNATGANVRRRADAVVMNIWPSRGLEIIGIEIKISRSDWIRERDNPEKAEAVSEFCDRWYLAASDDKIVAPGELPATWGLLVLEKGKIVQKVEAPKRDATPITRMFAAAILRRLAEVAPDKVALEKKYREGFLKGEETAKLHAESFRHGADKRLVNLQDQLTAFEQASGILINEYRGGKETGELVRLLGEITSADGLSSKMNVLRVNARSSAKAAETMIEAADAIEAALHPTKAAQASQEDA